MILIADSGSTKTNWALLQEKGLVHSFQTSGFNPNYSDHNEFSGSVAAAMKGHQVEMIMKIFFYGSGAGNPENDAAIRAILQGHFPGAEIEVHNDLMAACRGLAGKEPGVVCILGTGSNACIWDGIKMSQDQYSLGYLLGDEGSGFALGKRMLSSYLYEQMPEDLREAFYEMYPIDRNEVLKFTYYEPSPNQRIAGFSRFCSTVVQHPWMQEQIRSEMESFYQAFLFRSEHWPHPVHATGSVAGAFHTVFREVCSSHNRQTGQIIGDPMPGLISYHQQNY